MKTHRFYHMTVDRLLSSFVRFVSLPSCVLWTLLASGCVDTGGDPLAVAVASETRGAILLGDGIGTLPEILAAHGLEGSAAAEIESWRASWEMKAAEGTALRNRLYPLLVEELFPAVGRSGTEYLLGRSALTLAAAEGLGPLSSSGSIAEALSHARALHDEARVALAFDDPREALEMILRASDVLWTLSPQQVASDLLFKAREALGRNQELGSYSEEELTRIRRLTHGASEALEAGDYPGAIRRAYYACQLLGVGPP